ncbi:MAG: glycosyltransferase family 39 protein [Chloroflexota bacterium]
MKKYLPVVAVVAAMILSAIMHFWKIDTIGDSNAYYTAAVEAMTQSWHNFFYAAAEPGGSVTVDKPPLGLMIEAAFALVLGVSGFSTSLPNILAGILSVPLMYHLVKKHFGELAGVVAALVMALTPVVFAADRNNTMDGMLTFTLILAAWAFIKAVESNKARWLFLGAFIVGLGFNIKMLQAFLPLPAFLALYFFGAKTGWLKKIGLLTGALALLVAVSLSWALIVDSVPADERPYIGSSQDNSVMGLILGHNGTARLFGGRGGNQPALPAGQGAGPAFDGPDGFNPYASPDAGTNPPGLANRPQDAVPARGQGGGGTMFSNETGAPGVLRFFEPPLGAEMSWLLPFALVSLFVLLFQSKIRLPIESGAHLGLILWGGWLMTCVVFFSAVSGIFHAYYAVMLAPGLAGMVGGGFGALWKMRSERRGADWVLVVAAALTIAFQIYLAWQFGVSAFWQPLAFALAALGTILLMVGLFRASSFWPRAAYAVLLAAMLMVPFAWSALTVAGGADANLPAAYGVSGRAGGQRPANVAAANDNRPVNQPVANTSNTGDDALLTFLEANTQDVEYLLAVPSSQVGARYVIATGRPVLYMGGFSGGDPVVDAADLAGMVANGELRYVLYGGDQRNGDTGISNWLATSCFVVEEFSQGQVAAAGPGLPRPVGPNGQQLPVNPNGQIPGGPGNNGNILYDCG